MRVIFLEFRTWSILSSRLYGTMLTDTAIIGPLSTNTTWSLGDCVHFTHTHLTEGYHTLTPLISGGSI